MLHSISQPEKNFATKFQLYRTHIQLAYTTFVNSRAGCQKGSNIISKKSITIIIEIVFSLLQYGVFTRTAFSVLADLYSDL